MKRTEYYERYADDSEEEYLMHARGEEPPMPDENLETVGKLDTTKDSYPFAIVWSPIPLLTWLFPFIGHMGIADSAGTMYDFAGPYFIGFKELAFGRPTRYLLLDPAKIKAQGDVSAIKRWNRGIRAGNKEYSKRMHNLWYALLFIGWHAPLPPWLTVQPAAATIAILTSQIASMTWSMMAARAGTW